MTEEEIQVLIEMNEAVWDSYIPYLSAQVQQQLALGSFAGLTIEEIVANITAGALSPTQVETLLEATKDLSNKEVGSALKELNMEEVIKTKLSNIKTEYRNAHIEVLEDIEPPVNND